MKTSEIGFGKDEGKNAQRCARRHIEDIFARRRCQNQLQPFAIGRGFGIGSKCRGWGSAGRPLLAGGGPKR